MGMPRGLIKANAYYQNQSAWADWHRLELEHPELCARFAPPAGAGWRRVDRCIEKVRAQLTPPEGGEGTTQ